MTARRTLLPLAAAGLAVAGAVAPPAFASHGGGKADRVIATGKCSAGSTWKLKLKHDDGAIETELEVDQNRNNVTWKIVLSDNGSVIRRVSAKTHAPSGSFSYETRIANRTGKDAVRAVATRSGETCTATASL